ncbi:MAG TPA: hypothetical protein VGJ96_02090 [Gemmatimonadaceae bacterium]|jgi:predicted ArsR family transcriptional regulator
MNPPGLGSSQGAILERLKRRGEGSIPELAAALGLNIETVREHVKALLGRGLVLQVGTRRRGPGRPEACYGLSATADALFPRSEGEVLQELTSHLLESGHDQLLREFFAQRIGARRRDALARVAPLTGRARVEEVARILSEQGYMAVVEDDADALYLRLCHCPLRAVIQATRIPCGAEFGLIKELLGLEPVRVGHFADGDHSCAYRLEQPR